MENKLIDFFDELREKGLEESQVEGILDQEEDPLKMKKLYGEYLEMIEGIKLYQRNQLKAFLLADQDMPNTQGEIVSDTTKKVFRIRMLRFAGIAATILLLLFPLYSVFIYPHHVYSAFRQEEYNGNNMGIDDIQNWEVDESEIYQEAIKLEEVGQYQEALTRFEAIKSELFLVSARYNAALILIKLKRYEEATENLAFVSSYSEKHYLKEPAEELLKTLDRSRFYFLLYQ